MKPTIILLLGLGAALGAGSGCELVLGVEATSAGGGGDSGGGDAAVDVVSDGPPDTRGAGGAAADGSLDGAPDAAGAGDASTGDATAGDVPPGGDVPDGGGARVVHHWATWPMPNPPLPGLPNQQSYDTSVPDVVVDRITGLMWEQNAKGLWMDLTWGEAAQYCANLRLAGYADWYLPSRIEMVSLFDFSRAVPSIDPDVFPRTPTEFFWTSSASQTSLEAWYVAFGYNEGTDVAGEGGRHWVRCARSPARAAGAGAAPPHYSVQSDGVLDNWTGLTWQQAATAALYSIDVWLSTIDRCASLGNGWRLPSMKELQTLIDEQSASAPLDPVAFPNATPTFLWSSSADADYPDAVWQMNAADGYTSYYFEADAAVRCVR